MYRSSGHGETFQLLVSSGASGVRKSTLAWNCAFSDLSKKLQHPEYHLVLLMELCDRILYDGNSNDFQT